MWRWWLVVIVAACGDNTLDGWQSGPRMRARVLSAADGFTALDGWFDRELGESCGWPGEDDACGAVFAYAVYFRDPACSLPVIWPRQAGHRFVRARPPVAGSVDGSYIVEPTVYNGEVFGTDPTLGCVSLGALETSDARGVDLPIARFEPLDAHAVRASWPDGASWSTTDRASTPTSYGATRLRAFVDPASGVRGWGVLFDTARGETCWPQLAGDRMRCLPAPGTAPHLESWFYRDDRCTELADDATTFLVHPVIIERDGRPARVLYPTQAPATGPLWDLGAFYGCEPVASGVAFAARTAELSAFEELTVATE